MARSAPTFKKYIESISIDDAGSNYSSIPAETTLYIGPPNSSSGVSIQATGTLDIQNGSIAGITITEPGDGYSEAPMVYIQSGLGLGTSSLTFTGSADSRRDEGVYPGVSVTSMKDGTGAVATVTVDGTGNVTSVDVTTSGSLFMEGETVTITDISIGGTMGAPDMTFTVTQLRGGGNAITSFN